MTYFVFLSLFFYCIPDRYLCHWLVDCALNVNHCFPKCTAAMLPFFWFNIGVQYACPIDRRTKDSGWNQSPTTSLTVMARWFSKVAVHFVHIGIVVCFKTPNDVHLCILNYLVTQDVCCSMGFVHIGYNMDIERLLEHLMRMLRTPTQLTW